MTTRASAARYARALFDVALQELTPERAEQDIAAFADLLQQHPDLQRVLTNPVVPVANKRAVTQDLSARLQLSAPVSKLLLLLADRGRLGLVREVRDVYRERLMQHQQVVQAEVTTAMPLADDRAQGLADRLSSATGRKVMLTTRVDPTLIAGMVARVGGTVYDGSVVAHLDRLREQLVKQA